MKNAVKNLRKIYFAVDKPNDSCSVCFMHAYSTCLDYRRVIIFAR